ncbi:MAG: hypothetical protein GX541_06545 [Clostridiales bacterium]|jgi:pyruvate/2-oxoglutarate dehydrogenase complex dihydrolipoamide acyltransferase (E2) component|nr:hypothetical protein [Clostridiales bacterium]
MNKEQRRRRFGDRYDGYRVSGLDPMFTMIPYIMRSRSDSQVLLEERVDITELKKFISEQRKQNIPGLAMMHVVLAAIVRTISQKPRLNRFVSGGKIFARSYLRISMAIKREMDEDGDEALIMPAFEPDNTLHQVVETFNKTLSEIKSEKNDTDIAAVVLGSLPGFVKRFIVFTIRWLDSIGKMPKIINRLSPFHSSVFVTNVGSIGIGAVYHHLYEFGTTSVFVALGKKEQQVCLDSDGNPETREFITFRFVVDERICDGYYYASAIRLFFRYLKHPEQLLTPPEEVKHDC